MDECFALQLRRLKIRRFLIKEFIFRTSATPPAAAPGAGIGEISDRQIQQRAEELAVHEGLPDVTSDLLERARNELTQSVHPAGSDDDLANVSEEARAPEDAVGSSGQKVKNRGPGDEGNIPNALTEEGVAEAAHERTVEAEKASKRRAE